MNIVFIGTTKFSLKCLSHIIQEYENNIVGVVTAKEKFSISYSKKKVININYVDLSLLCKKNKLPIEVLENSMQSDLLFNKVKSWKPDIFIVIGWYYLIPKHWRELAPAYGIHASLLPDYSGGAPLVWAIINGEKETGVTFFQFDDGVDSGPIIAQKKTIIDKKDDINTLYQKIENLSLSILSEEIPNLINKTTKSWLQDNSKRRTFPQRQPEDGLIDWSQNAEYIYNFIRAQTKPYPGAFFFYQKKKITIWASEINNIYFESDRKYQYVNNRLFIRCGNNTSIEIKKIAINGEEAEIIKLKEILNL